MENNLLTLTLKDSNVSFELSENDIISLVGANSGVDSEITYVNDNRSVNTVVVDETPTAIKAIAPTLIDVTLTNLSTLTINSSKIRTVYAEGSGSQICYNEEGASWNRVNITQTPSQIQALVNIASAEGSSQGTAGTGVTAVEYGNGRDIVTVLTLTNLTYAITGAVSLGLGKLIYTFPAGAHVHEASYMRVALQGTGVVNTDTPVVGIGSVIATGAVSVLSGTATFQDYIAGQTATNCNGSFTTKTAVATAGALTGISINEAASVKNVHLNIADAWAGADTITLNGVVTLKWTIMS